MYHPARLLQLSAEDHPNVRMNPGPNPDHSLTGSNSGMDHVFWVLWVGSLNLMARGQILLPRGDSATLSSIATHRGLKREYGAMMRVSNRKQIPGIHSNEIAESMK